MKEGIWFQVYLFFVSSPFFLLYIPARMFGLIKIEGWDLKKFIPGKNGLITYSNHVTNAEVVVIPLLLYPLFLFNARLFIHTVAKKKWYGKPWFAPLRPAAILVSPGEGMGAEGSMKEVISLLKRGYKIVHIYPSGTRLKLTKATGKEVKTLGEREIGRFYPGMLAATLATKSDLLPIWIKVGKRPLMTIIIGERVSFSSLEFPDKRFSELTKEEIRGLLEKPEDMLLNI